MPVAMALPGMPSYRVVFGSWTSTSPPFSLIARNPNAPSLPVPESTMQMALSPWSSASERKKKSMGCRNPLRSTGSNS
jgi:hypothetical protein